MTRLLTFIALLVGGFFVLHWWQPIRHHEHANQEIVIGLVGIVYLLIVVIMLTRTRWWTIRALGLVAALAGDALFWLDLLWRLLDTEHNLPGTPPPVAITNDIILDCFLIGGLFLLFSIMCDGHDDWRGWRARRKGARQ